MPSQYVFDLHIANIKQKTKLDVISYYHRKKLHGWHEHNEMAVLSNGKAIYKCKMMQNFKDLFYKNLSLRESCFACSYAGEKEIFDMCIGDFWGVNRILPSIDDDLGVSAAIISNRINKGLLDYILKNAHTYALNDGDVFKYNHCKPCTKPTSYENFWRDITSKEQIAFFRKYANDNFFSNTIYYLKQFTRRILVKLKLKEK